MKKFKIFIAILLLSFTAGANVTLPQIFTTGMVLQRDQNIPVWGWAKPNEHVTVMLKNQHKNVTTDKDGNWMVQLDPETAGGPFQLVIKGENTIVIDSVLIGEVWICSGQSNMEFPVAATMNATVEISEANYPLIRQFTVPVRTSLQPLDNLNGGEWKTCSPATVSRFSAVAYFFARALQHELNVPIGLIDASCGGTIIETWISKNAFEESDLFKQMITKLPTETVEELNERRMKLMMKKIDSLQGGLPKENEMVNWMKPAFDDTRWPVMNLPGIWETKGWPELDGKVWFRKEFTINDVSGLAGAELDLGTVDDNDETYINGVKIGATVGNLQQERKYKIPAGLLAQGKNLVAVQIEDVIGGGGLTSDAPVLKIKSPKTTIPLAGDWHYKIEYVAKTGFAVYPDDYPTLLYNGMINPLKPYSIKGVIWYQGESNADRAFEYRTAFPLLIHDWRQRWNKGNFPFLFVQLASFENNTGNSKGSAWAELREAQTLALNEPNTGMAITTDIGDPHDIHPKNKQEVGRRLAAIALHKVYSKQNPYTGPAYKAMKIINSKAVLSFNNIENGMLIKDKYGYVKGFKIAGSDQHFHYARAYIEGKNIVVYCDSVTKPLAVRYAWSDSPDDANVYNKEGFPMIPFRTDNWPAITKDVKYYISNKFN
jgi:sialate O-acetylesterase